MSNEPNNNEHLKNESLIDLYEQGYLIDALEFNINESSKLFLLDQEQLLLIDDIELALDKVLTDDQKLDIARYISANGFIFEIKNMRDGSEVFDKIIQQTNDEVFIKISNKIDPQLKILLKFICNTGLKGIKNDSDNKDEPQIKKIRI